MPIYLHITIEGEVSELCTSRKCELTSWDKRTGKVLGKNEAAKELNHYLSTCRMKVFEARLLLIEQSKTVTAVATAIRFLLRQFIVRSSKKAAEAAFVIRPSHLPFASTLPHTGNRLLHILYNAAFRV